VAYRTRRAFREQLYVVGLLSRIERAEQQAATARERRRPRAERRAARELARHAAALSSALEAPSLHRVAPSDLLSEVRDVVVAGAPQVDVPPAAVAPGLKAVVLAACAAAWALTVMQVLLHGIDDRLSLVVPELAGIVLAPLATLLSIRATPGD